MKIVCLSDTHMFHKHIKIPECDILLHAGDFTMKGRLTEIESFADWMSIQPAKHKIVIPGNHDFGVQEDSVRSKEYFSNLGVNLLIDEKITIDGINVYGSPWQPWFFNWAYNFPRDFQRYQECAVACWDLIPDDVNILLTHGPPKNILDKVKRVISPNESENVGCTFLKQRIDNLKHLKLHVFGHIHEARGILTESERTYINASSVTAGKYSIYPEPVIFEYNK